MENVNKDIVQDDNKKKKKRMAIIIAAIVLIAAVIGIFLYTNAITAVTMRIQRLVGTVNLYNESGDEQSLREKMRLGVGQTVTTAGESLIMVSLDDTKLMTMEESSRAEIKARGKKLLFNLLEGNLFFNVTEKLKDNESFDVQTSTMICGIRGTSAYVGRDSTSHEILMVTDGLVHVVATNPVTLETTEVDVPAGQMITIYLDDEAEGNKTISIKMRSFVEEDLPALALDAIRKDTALLDKVSKATGFSTKKLITLAELSSTKGVSMFGAAADDLRRKGIDDAIPYMGSRAHEMIDSANSAYAIAGEDLPLEVAIIQGYKDVLDTVSSAGYNRDDTGRIMRGARGCMEGTFIRVEEAGLNGTDRIRVAVGISDTLTVSVGRMTGAGLSADEIAEVEDAMTVLYTSAVGDAAADTTDGSKASDIISAVDRVSGHVTSTVDEEMNKSSDGDETVEALLGGDGSKDGESIKEDDAVEQTDDAKKTETEQTTDTDGEGSPKTGDGDNGSKTGSTGSSERIGGATPQEIKAALATIIATDPATGIVALADGTLFDPNYYAAANPDVVAEYGTSTGALLAEWLKEGKAQGRPPIAQTTIAATETKPDWLIRQEEEERRKSRDDDDDDDDESSSDSSGGGSAPTGLPGSATNPVSYSNDTVTVGSATAHVGNYGAELTFTSGPVDIEVPYYLVSSGTGNAAPAGQTGTVQFLESVHFDPGVTGNVRTKYGSTTVTREVGTSGTTYSYTDSTGTHTGFTTYTRDTPQTGWDTLSGLGTTPIYIERSTGTAQTTPP